MSSPRFFFAAISIRVRLKLFLLQFFRGASMPNLRERGWRVCAPMSSQRPEWRSGWRSPNWGTSAYNIFSRTNTPTRRCEAHVIFRSNFNTSSIEVVLFVASSSNSHYLELVRDICWEFHRGWFQRNAHVQNICNGTSRGVHSGCSTIQNAFL